MSDDIVKHAGAVAAYITQNVLLEEGLTPFGVLDALASLGLKLVKDSGGESNIALYEDIQRTTEGRD